MTPEERISRLEGAYDHLANKADLANLKADLANLKADLVSQINRQTWAMITVQLLVLGALVAVLRLWG